jgi:hypothetical protein
MVMHTGKVNDADLILVICDRDYVEGYELAETIAGSKVKEIKKKNTCPNVHFLSVEYEDHKLTVILACHLHCINTERLSTGIPILLLLHYSNLVKDGEEAYAVSQQPDSVFSQLKKVSGDKVGRINNVGRINFSAGVTGYSLDSFGFENLVQKLPQFVQEILNRKTESLQDVLTDLQYRSKVLHSADTIRCKLTALDTLIKGYLTVRNSALPPGTNRDNPHTWFKECLPDLEDIFDTEMDKEVERIEKASRFGGPPTLGEIFHSRRSLTAKSNLRRLVEILKSGNDKTFQSEAEWPEGFFTKGKSDEDILDFIQAAHRELIAGFNKIEEYLT